MKKIIIFLSFLLNANVAFGYVNETIQNQCGIMGNKFFAIHTINSYTCQSGEFLPAYTLGCQPCPSGYTCSGGTYVFNENKYQGAVKSATYIDNDLTNMCSINAYHEMIAKITPNQHTCNAGYYMPANYDGCVICPADNYCVGGTYTFNETTTQGITACGAGLFAPAGMWEPEQCGRILHVGDGFVYLRSTKKTEHALHVDLNHDGIADYFGNMTTLDVPMSRDTPRKLKVRMNGVLYSIYDDSVDLSLYE